MFHVPPGINTYDGKPTWNEKYAVYYQEPFMDNKTLLMFVMMVLIVIVGTALDFAPTVLILTPVLIDRKSVV